MGPYAREYSEILSCHAEPTAQFGVNSSIGRKTAAEIYHGVLDLDGGSVWLLDVGACVDAQSLQLGPIKR